MEEDEGERVLSEPAWSNKVAFGLDFSSGYGEWTRMKEDSEGDGGEDGVASGGGGARTF